MAAPIGGYSSRKTVSDAERRAMWSYYWQWMCLGYVSKDEALRRTAAHFGVTPTTVANRINV